MSPLSLFSEPSRFWRGNLHTHSTLSDGALEPPQVIEAYRNAGYDFLSLTDHFIGHYHWPVADTGALRTDKFTTIIGAELHAPATAVGELWHILANGLPLDFAPCGEDETGPELALPRMMRIFAITTTMRSAAGCTSRPRASSRKRCLKR